MEAEAQRLLQRALLGEAIDYAEGVAVFVWNEERRYVAVNEAACRLVGLGREELIGTPVGGMTAQGAEPQFAAVRSGITDGTLSFTRGDGEQVELEWTTLPTKVAGLAYWVSICRRR
jgi:PAS domain S-box-containing protein